ncbi:MAG TPA: ATP-dependent zinc metalloprotease FtsH [Chloroflexota bacterium]|nr:ATP-dependent zinc metalloprotease FtsH [Chloroflexota bacterium]
MINIPRGSGQQSSPTPSGGPSGRPPRVGMSGRTWIIFLIVLLLFNVVFYGPLLNSTSTNPTVTLPYSTFLTQVKANDIKTANISTDTVDGSFVHPYKASGKTYSQYTTTLLPVPDPNLVPTLESHNVQLVGKSTATPLWLDVLGLLLQALPFLFFIGLIYFGMQGARRQQQGIFGFGQSRAKLYTEERPSTTFADVAGVDNAKAELQEEVDFLRNPTKYQRLGARIPKGVLLVGPPGTGKTLLARAVAGEARVPFFSISATEFVEMFVGVGASRVRDLFDKARASAPAIIFIDELDAIGRRRGGGGPLAGSNDEREQTLNQLLVSMDGFEPNEAVIVMAATNRPEVLDPALLRPGRFDRQVVVDPPDRQGREAILRIHTRNLPLAPDVNLAAIAQATAGMSGADLANLANEAALAAARKGHTQITAKDFDDALDRVTLGAPGAALMNEEERRTVAYHEGGHALVAYLIPNTDPIRRVTITPRGRSLGVTQFLPIDDRRNYRRDYLLDRMAVGLGGRSAEEVAIGEITSGAQNDLQVVTRTARAMVTQLGMADELGPEYLGGSEDGLDGAVSPWEPKEYSDETAQRIDSAVSRLIDEAHKRARDLLSANRAALDAIAHALFEEESLTFEQVDTLIRAIRAGVTATPATPDNKQQKPAG